MPHSNCRSIYIDFDDVISETAEMLLSVLEQSFHKIVNFNDIAHFDLGKSFGLKPDELAEFMATVHRPENLAVFRPRDGATEVLAYWQALQYDICIVTGRPPSTREISSKWLQEKHIPFKELIFVDKYSREDWVTRNVEPAISLEELYEMEFCLAVEDSLSTAVNLARNTAYPIAIMDRPWNRDTTAYGSLLDHGRVSRCRDWYDLKTQFPNP